MRIVLLWTSLRHSIRLDIESVTLVNVDCTVWRKHTNRSKWHETAEMLYSDLSSQDLEHAGGRISSTICFEVQHKKHMSSPSPYLWFSPCSSHSSLFPMCWEPWRIFTFPACGKFRRFWSNLQNLEGLRCLYKAACVYDKILLSLKWIARKTLKYLFVKAFPICFLSIFSEENIDSGYLGFVSCNWNVLLLKVHHTCKYGAVAANDFYNKTKRKKPGCSNFCQCLAFSIQTFQCEHSLLFWFVCIEKVSEDWQPDM